MKRLSRGTPHILTTGEIEAILATVKVDPLLEQALADTYEMTVETWRKTPAPKRVKLIVDSQEHGRLSAVLAGSLKARRDLIGESLIVKDGTDPASMAEQIKSLAAGQIAILERLDNLTGHSGRKAV